MIIGFGAVFISPQNGLDIITFCNGIRNDLVPSIRKRKDICVALRVAFIPMI
jgi:hypothetical protein